MVLWIGPLTDSCGWFVNCKLQWYAHDSFAQDLWMPKIGRVDSPLDCDFQSRNTCLAHPTAVPVPSNALKKNLLVLAMLAASVGVLFYLWTLNYNKLGSFYDYSIMANAAGKYAAGLRPVRDFASPLQTFPIWLAHACEILFGPRYLALAYGNLFLSLGLFFVVVHFARKAFSFPVAVLTGMAVPVASSLQHGIIWYNSIGLLLLSAIALKCADLLRARAIRSSDAIWVTSLLLLLGMTKMNFYALAISTAGFFTLTRALSAPRFRNGKKITALAIVAAAVCIAPPIVETLANHTSLSTWVRQVILIPTSSRVGGLRWMLTSAFYTKELNRWWPGTVLQGSVLFCLVVYVFLICFAILQFREDGRRGYKDLSARLGLIFLFWASTVLLVLTNIDIESLSLSFCLVGVIAMRLSGRFPGAKLERSLQASAIVLATYFLLVGGVSLARHSRISYLANGFPGETIPSNGEPAYLRGVELSHQSAGRLAVIDYVLKSNSGVPVYWGPGLEIMNRIHGGVNEPAFPLWYQSYTTVSESSTPGLVDAIERSGAGLVVVDPFWFEYYGVIPDGLRAYLWRDWDLEEWDYWLIVFRKREPGQYNTGSATP
jgi:hypothetical protein